MRSSKTRIFSHGLEFGTWITRNSNRNWIRNWPNFPGKYWVQKWLYGKLGRVGPSSIAAQLTRTSFTPIASRHPRTRWQFCPGNLPLRRCSAILDQDAHRARHHRKRRRSTGLERSAWPFRDKAHQSSRGLQLRRIMHELGGKLFQPPSPCGSWTPSSYRWRLFAPLRPRGFMA